MSKLLYSITLCSLFTGCSLKYKQKFKPILETIVEESENFSEDLSSRPTGSDALGYTSATPVQGLWTSEDQNSILEQYKVAFKNQDKAILRTIVHYTLGEQAALALDKDNAPFSILFLRVVAMYFHRESVEMVLRHPVYRKEVSRFRDASGQTILHIFAKTSSKNIPVQKIKDVLQVCARYGLNVNATNTRSATPLHVAVKYGNEKMVEALLGHPTIKVNIKNKRGATPLHLAVGRRFTAIVKVLLDHPKIDVNIKDPFGYSLLYSVAGINAQETVELLLSHPTIDVNITDTHGSTPLHEAVRGNYIEIVNLLVVHPAINVNAKRKDGFTPLHLATRLGWTAIVQLLLKHGADVYAKDSDHETALFLAIADNQPDCIPLLKAAGKDRIPKRSIRKWLCH